MTEDTAQAAEVVEKPKKERKPRAKAAKTPAKAKKVAKKAAQEGSGVRGRVSKYAGKKIVKLVKDNPRHEGTIGYNSWKVLTSGMTYEKYIAAGGRRVDLEFDLEHEYIKLA